MHLSLKSERHQIGKKTKINCANLHNSVIRLYTYVTTTRSVQSAKVAVELKQIQMIFPTFFPTFLCVYFITLFGHIFGWHSSNAIISFGFHFFVQILWYFFFISCSNFSYMNICGKLSFIFIIKQIISFDYQFECFKWRETNRLDRSTMTHITLDLKKYRSMNESHVSSTYLTYTYIISFDFISHSKTQFMCIK